jgi:hypothetical protein
LTPDPADRQIGQWSRRNMKSMMRAWGLYPLTSRGGMSLTDFNNLVDRAGEELEQLHLKPYLAMYVLKATAPRPMILTKGRYICCGRKP